MEMTEQDNSKIKAMRSEGFDFVLARQLSRFQAEANKVFVVHLLKAG